MSHMKRPLLLNDLFTNHAGCPVYACLTCRPYAHVLCRPAIPLP